MTDLVLTLVVLALGLAIWFFTRGHQDQKRILVYLIFAVSLFLLLISFRKRIPLWSHLVDWFRNRSDDKQIEELEKSIKRIKGDRDSSVISANEAAAKAEELREQALNHIVQMSLLEETIKGAPPGEDPQKEAEKALPPLTGDALLDAESLLLELKARNQKRKQS